MIVTKDNIIRLASDTGGWPKDTILKLGLSWPLKSGWKEQLYGRDIPDNMFRPEGSIVATVPTFFMNGDGTWIEKEKIEIELFSDGACDNAYSGTGTNFGAWCVILHHNHTKNFITGIEENTTNNRMEIMGLKLCLDRLLPRGFKRIRIVTDSMYVIRCFKKMPKNYFKKMPNSDLWHPIYQNMIAYQPVFTLDWVKGHNGHAENELCNDIAEKIVRDFVEGRTS